MPMLTFSLQRATLRHLLSAQIEHGDLLDELRSLNSDTTTSLEAIEEAETRLKAVEQRFFELQVKASKELVMSGTKEALFEADGTSYLISQDNLRLRVIRKV